MWSFVTGSFHLACCFQGSSMLYYVSVLHSFLLLNDIPCMDILYQVLFIYSFFFLIYFFKIYTLLYFFHYHLLPLYTPPPSNHHTIVHVHESFFLFAQSLHPLTTPTSCHLFSIYKSVSVSLVSSVCSLDSMYHVLFIHMLVGGQLGFL